jgi:hypothetical protein
MDVKECLLKDRVLKYLCETKRSGSDTEIANVLGYEGFEVGFAGEQMEKFKMIELLEITGKDSFRNEYILSLQTRGRYFFKYNSFMAEYRTWRRQELWKNVKIIAGTLNAITIIVIAIISLQQNNAEDKYQKDVNSDSKSLESKADSIGMLDRVEQKIDSIAFNENH